MKAKLILISFFTLMAWKMDLSAQTQNAIDFDGINDQVMGDVFALTPAVNNFTIEFWVRTTATVTIQPQQNCLSCITGTPGFGQRYALYPTWGGSGGNAGAGVSMGTNGILVYEHAASYMPALLVYNATLPAGWNHVAVVYIAKQPRLYLNGNLVATGLTSLKNNVYPSLTIGGASYGWFPGQIDEFRIWNVSRTEAQIRSEMHRELLTPVTETNLIVYYQFNETSGTLAPDLSASGNNATLTNMDPATDWIA
ncbi:MAG: LamG domain-containing protein, partial [Bacteroidales bacterium]|nr:LamG domain-containing protein [Bacteroidales bacterium]